MHRTSEGASQPVPNKGLPWRWALVGYALGMFTLPVVYLLVYFLLRLSGVYYPSWSQGSWDEIDGTTNVFVLDVLFLPAEVFEVQLANRYHFLKEPTM